MSTNPVELLLRKELEKAGLTYEVKHRGKHPRIVFTVGGRVMQYFFPSTPSDQRGGLNCRAGLRRLLRDAGVTL